VLIWSLWESRAYDVLIAGQALNRGMTLVTRNIGEFSRVDSLTLENWENE
jgi:tRNA(fMet)-specific endonuclease VapC